MSQAWWRLWLGFGIASGGLSLMLAGETPAPAGEPDDPYLWLEDVTGEKSLAWVRRGNAESTGELTGTAAFQTLNNRILRDPRLRRPHPLHPDARRALLQLLARRQEPPRPVAAHHAGGVPQGPGRAGKWCSTSTRWARPRGRTGSGTAPASLAPTYKRAWFRCRAAAPTPAVVREFDLTTRFVKDGFALPEAKSEVAWRDSDSLYVGTDFGPGSLTDVGLPADRQGLEARHAAGRRRRRSSRASPTTWRAPLCRDLTPGFERDFVGRRPTSSPSEIFLRRDGKLVKIDKPDDAQVAFHREWLLLQLRTDWTVGGRTYPAGALLAADFEAFLTATAPSTSCSRRPSASRWPASARRGTTSCSTCSTTCAAASTC